MTLQTNPPADTETVDAAPTAPEASPRPVDDCCAPGRTAFLTASPDQKKHSA